VTVTVLFAFEKTTRGAQLFCDSEKACEARLDAVLQYLATDVDIEIASTIKHMVHDVRA
jgi:hypothetical protein